MPLGTACKYRGPDAFHLPSLCLLLFASRRAEVSPGPLGTGGLCSRKEAETQCQDPRLEEMGSVGELHLTTVSPATSAASPHPAGTSAAQTQALEMHQGPTESIHADPECQQQAEDAQGPPCGAPVALALLAWQLSQETAPPHHARPQAGTHVR